MAKSTSKTGATQRAPRQNLPPRSRKPSPKSSPPSSSPSPESFIYNAVRKTMDQGQLELTKSGNRQPVPVTTRYYSMKQRIFIFNDTDDAKRSDFLTAKVYWLSRSPRRQRSPVWIADPCDAQYLNTTVRGIQSPSPQNSRRRRPSSPLSDNGEIRRPHRRALRAPRPIPRRSRRRPQLHQAPLQRRHARRPHQHVAALSSERDVPMAVPFD